MLKKPEELNGKTIQSCEQIKAEFGRTSSSYLCFVFTDGTKHLIECNGFTFCDPKPKIEEMQKARNFFTAEEIAGRVLEIEREERVREAEQQWRKKQRYLELKKEFEVMEQAEREEGK